MLSRVEASGKSRVAAVGAAGRDDCRPRGAARWGGSGGCEALGACHGVSQGMPDGHGVELVDAAHREAGQRSIAGLGVDRFRGCRPAPCRPPRPTRSPCAGATRPPRGRRRAAAGGGLGSTGAVPARRSRRRPGAAPRCRPAQRSRHGPDAGPAAGRRPRPRHVPAAVVERRVGDRASCSACNASVIARASLTRRLRPAAAFAAGWRLRGRLEFAPQPTNGCAAGAA
jgi:hypothetical protein